jgi:4-oxalocrotonate tautomerase
MPIIHIEIARGRNAADLSNMACEVSRAAAESLSVQESGIRVIVDEVDPNLWFSGGQSLADKTHSTS